MKVFRISSKISVFFIISVGLILMGSADGLAQGDGSVSDSPPVLSERMADPSWSIAYWISVDQKSSDCVAADQLMDQNVNRRTIIGRRGRVVAIYYLDDYIHSCQNRIERMLALVEPRVKEWCDYRDTSKRLDVICWEWELNKNKYINRIREIDGPTLMRYNQTFNRN